MEIGIQAIHFDVSEKLVAFINKKIERLARHYTTIDRADVTLKVVKPETAMNKEVVIRISAPECEDMVATKVADSFEEATDLALEAIDRQLNKKKAKKIA